MNEALEFILQNDTELEGLIQKDQFEEHFHWVENHGQVLVLRDQGEITEVGMFIGTSYPELNYNRILENQMGALNDEGEYIYVFHYVRSEPLKQGLIPLEKLKDSWKSRFRNAKWIYYHRRRDDGRLIKAPIQ